MLRSFIPFLLASLGVTMIFGADRSPLYEWQVSKIVTDLSSACDFDLPTYLTTRLGESFDAERRENLNIVVRRSRADETLDRVSLALDNNVPWLLVGVILSIIYMWWFLLWYKQDKASHVVIAVFLTAIAVGMCFLLSQVVRLAGPAVGWRLYCFGESCHGTITFDARLLKIHYDIAAILFAGILMELGALGMMLRQIIRAVTEGKKPSQWAVS